MPINEIVFFNGEFFASTETDTPVLYETDFDDPSMNVATQTDNIIVPQLIIAPETMKPHPKKQNKQILSNRCRRKGKFHTLIYTPENLFIKG